MFVHQNFGVLETIVVPHEVVPARHNDVEKFLTIHNIEHFQSVADSGPSFVSRYSQQDILDEAEHKPQKAVHSMLSDELKAEHFVNLYETLLAFIV